MPSILEKAAEYNRNAQRLEDLALAELVAANPTTGLTYSEQMFYSQTLAMSMRDRLKAEALTDYYHETTREADAPGENDEPQEAQK